MQEIVLPSKEEARTVFDALRRLLDNYEKVSMANYLNLVGISSVYSDEKIGWTELINIPIKSVHGGFVLDLPEPKCLDTPIGAFPFLKGWWFVADVIHDQKYEGWLVDYIGNTVILETEPSKIRTGILLHTIMKFDAYRERPSNSE